MLVIRLARTGKKKQAYFRVVVAQKERAVGAKFIEILGNYNPHQKKLEIDKEKLEKYLSNGAQPSNTLASILKKEKIELPKWVKIKEKNRPPKKAEEDKQEKEMLTEDKSVSENQDVAEGPEKESDKEIAEDKKEEKTESPVKESIEESAETAQAEEGSDKK